MSIAKYNIGDNCYYVTEKNENNTYFNQNRKICKNITHICLYHRC